MSDEPIDAREWANMILSNASEDRVNAIITAINRENSQPGDMTANVMLACCHVLGAVIESFGELAPQARVAVLSIIDKGIELAVLRNKPPAGAA